MGHAGALSPVRPARPGGEGGGARGQSGSHSFCQRRRQIAQRSSRDNVVEFDRPRRRARRVSPTPPSPYSESLYQRSTDHPTDDDHVCGGSSDHSRQGPEGMRRGPVARGAFARGRSHTQPMAAHLSLRSNTTQRRRAVTRRRWAVTRGGDPGGTSVDGEVPYRVIPTLFALLILLVWLLLRTTMGLAVVGAVCGSSGSSPTAAVSAGTAGVHSQRWTGTVGAILILLIGSGWSSGVQLFA